jgi:hypothetical protein
MGRLTAVDELSFSAAQVASGFLGAAAFAALGPPGCAAVGVVLGGLMAAVLAERPRRPSVVKVTAST